MGGEWMIGPRERSEIGRGYKIQKLQKEEILQGFLRVVS